MIASRKFTAPALALFAALSVCGARAADLPNIHVIATGGTIAGAQASAQDYGYKSGAYDVNTLIDAVPNLNKLADKYRSSGFTLLGVNVDEDPRNATSAAAKAGVTFPVLLDAEKRVVKMYDVATMPTTVLIDRDGRMRYLHRGYREGYEATYDQQVRQLLKE